MPAANFFSSASEPALGQLARGSWPRRRASGSSAPGGRHRAPASPPAARGSGAASAPAAAAGAPAPGSLRTGWCRSDTRPRRQRSTPGNRSVKTSPEHRPVGTLRQDRARGNRPGRNAGQRIQLDAAHGRCRVRRLCVDFGQRLVLVVPDVHVGAGQVVSGESAGRSGSRAPGGRPPRRSPAGRGTPASRSARASRSRSPARRDRGSSARSRSSGLLDGRFRDDHRLRRCAPPRTPPRRCRWAPSCRSARASGCRPAGAWPGRAIAAPRQGSRSGTPGPNTRSARCASSPTMVDSSWKSAPCRFRWLTSSC